MGERHRLNPFPVSFLSGAAAEAPHPVTPKRLPGKPEKAPKSPDLGHLRIPLSKNTQFTGTKPFSVRWSVTYKQDLNYKAMLKIIFLQKVKDGLALR